MPEYYSERTECPRCGSSRGLATQTDGQWGHCHSCGENIRLDGAAHTNPFTPENENMPGLIAQEDITFAAIPSRGLHEPVARKYRYGVADYKGEKVHVAQWMNAAGTVVAQKVRKKDKSFLILGDAEAKKSMGLFGQHLCRTNDTRLVITEGELDALAASEALGGNWSVVSLPNGASSAKKHMLRHVEFLEGYDKVILCFDQDAPGRKAVEECLGVLQPGKLHIASLPRKDACEMTANGEIKKLRDCLWSAPQYRPEGIVNGSEIMDHIRQALPAQGHPYEWEGMEEKLMGIRPKELVLFAGGTGSGKSTVTRAITRRLLEDKIAVGYVALEESVDQSALSIFGMHMGRNFRVSGDDLPFDEIEAVNKELGSNLFLYDHFGSVESDSLLSKIRFLIKGCGCKVIVLDHISIAISGLDIDDERKALDVMMTKLRSLIEETQATIFVVCHLSRPKDGSHEEGAKVQLRHLRGSHSLGQIPDIICGVERDQSATGDSQNTLLFRILKNRPIGRLGVACAVQYDETTGRMTETLTEGEGFGAVEEQDGEEF